MIKTEIGRERNTAKKLTACIMSILKFWRLCKKKKPVPPLDLKKTESNTLRA